MAAWSLTDNRVRDDVPGTEPIDNQDLLLLDCDVLIPALLEYVLNQDNGRQSADHTGGRREQTGLVLPVRRVHLTILLRQNKGRLPVIGKPAEIKTASNPEGLDKPAPSQK